MTEGWQRGPLIGFAELVSTGPFGSMLHKSDYVSDGVPLINPTNIVGESILPDREKQVGVEALSRLSSYVLKAGDVVVGRRGEIGRCAVVGADATGWVCGTGCFFIRPGLATDPHFLAWLLRSPDYRDQLERASTGATMKNMSNTTLAQLPVAIPEIGEQRRIVAIFDEAFEAIATAKANAEKNLQNATELFAQHREVALAGCADWDEAILSSLCDIKHGYAFEGAYFAEQGDHVLLTPGSFHEIGGFRDRGDKTKYYTGPIPQAFVLNEGDLLVAMTEQAAGLLGSPLLVPESGRYLHNQRLGRVIGKPGVPWLNEFFFHVFNLHHVRQEIHASGSGAKVRHTSPGKIGAVRVRYPRSVDDQRALANRLVELSIECLLLASVQERKITALNELKQSLLHQAFSGQL